MRPSCILLLLTMIWHVPATAQRTANQDKQKLGPIQTFDPAHQKLISYTDESLQITLVMGQDRDSVRILDRASKLEKYVALPVEMAQVDEIRKVVKNTLVVRGMVNGSGSEIVVIDLSSAKVIDKFLCYLPSVSPDGRYIAYIKFYPMHFSEGTEDHYLLYDLSKEPRENRPASVRSNDWIDVGRCVYPLGIGNLPGDNVSLREGPVHGSVSAGFFWRSDAKEFLFADQVHPSKEIDLVLVDIGSGGKIDVRTAHQSMQQVCPPFGDPRHTEPCSLIVRGVHFLSKPRPALKILFEIVGLRELVTREYEVSQFHPTG